MKLYSFLTALVALALATTTSMAAERYVDNIGGSTDVANNCLSAVPACATVAHALAQADPGDTIKILSTGVYAESGILITKDFITIQGPPFNAATPATIGRGEAEFGGVGAFDYVFGIQAHNVTIEGIGVNATGNTDPWAGIRILPGGWDRWTIRNNQIWGLVSMDGTPGADVPNRSFGIYGDAQTTNGTLTMTGGMITGNAIHTLGFGPQGGANVTSGVGVYLEGISGEDADCDTINRFTCGVWVYDNSFRHLYTGQRQTLQGVTTPGGKEYSYGVMIAQDAQNAQPNNGAWVGGDGVLDDNAYFEDTSFDHGTPLDMMLEVGVSIGIGGSTVNEDNAAFNNETVMLVINNDRKATINELILARFYKSLHPRVFGEGTDLYARTNVDAKALSASTATIMQVEPVGFGSVELYVRPQTKEGVSYKVSLDNQGDFNLRLGARLLFDAPLAGINPGVDQFWLLGTEGDDLLTLDFNNGNPLPYGFNRFNYDTTAVFKGGFDALAVRGDEQQDYVGYTLFDSGFYSPSGVAYFDGIAPQGNEPVTSGKSLRFDGTDAIDDLLIVNARFSVETGFGESQEINLVNGPFRYGFDTFQINSGATPTFPRLNFANKKHVNVYGSDLGGDVFTVFTEDGDAPDLLLSLNLFGGRSFDFGTGLILDETEDDYFVVRPSKDYDISVDGGLNSTGDWFFIDCATTDASCDLTGFGAGTGTYSALSGAGFHDVDYANINSTPATLTSNLTIKKELIGFAQDGAHPGDEIQYKVTVKNTGGAFNFSGTPVWITDVIDHRLSLVEQSVVTQVGTVQVMSGNPAMLWKIADNISFATNQEYSMTYKVIVNTLITTEDVHNFASILNPDPDVDQHDDVDATPDHFAVASLDVLDVFGFPVKAAIQASLFYETEAGPRYMVGLYGGATDPAQGNIGAMLCRVPDTNREVGWDGGLGNLWYSCGTGLPNTDGLFAPLVVTDLFQDSAKRVWLTSWGFEGLYYSDDGGQTWVSAMADLSGGQGGAPDGIPDGFAQIYAITEDILGTLFISANNGDVYRSFDRGATWQKAKQLPLGSADTAYSLEADPTVPGKLYAGTFGDGLYVTSDFAETWQRPDLDGLGSTYVFDIEIDPISGNLFVGTAKGVYFSPDGGDNWDGLNTAFPFPTNPPEIRNIAFDANGTFFASTWGQGVWSSLDWQADALDVFALKTANVLDMTVSGGFVSILTDTGATYRFAYEGRASSVDNEEITAELPQGYTLEQNYPNPFNPTTSIAFSLPQSVQVNLTVFDVLGRRVATLVSGQMPAGQHQVQFEASSLPSGMYLYRLSTPAGSITQKMMLLK